MSEIKQMLTCVGLGMDSLCCLTREAEEALREAELIIGSPRLLALLGEEYSAPKAEAITAAAIAEIMKGFSGQNACAVYSGDTGFYSGSALLQQQLPHTILRVLPGISSLQYLASRLGLSWQNWKLLSGHGRSLNLAAEFAAHDECFFLTDSRLNPGVICEAALQAGYGDAEAYVGENLGGDKEQILQGTAKEFANKAFAPLSVLLIRHGSSVPLKGPVYRDDVFERAEGIPLTKQDIRAILAVRLPLKAEDTVWEIGCGTGGITALLANLAYNGKVYAVDKKELACRLTKRNMARLGLSNVEITCGAAPDVCDILPEPDFVFFGGSSGCISTVLAELAAAGLHPRVGFTAVTPDTFAEAWQAMKQAGYELTATQICVSTTRTVGSAHMFAPQSPVFAVIGE